MSAPHAKAVKSGPWCNTTPTLRQRAKRRRHSLGGADELQPRSLTKDERTRPAEVVSKDATPTAARGEDAGVPASDLTGSSPPQPPVEYHRAGYETADGREVDLNDDGAFHSIVTPEAPLRSSDASLPRKRYIPHRELADGTIEILGGMGGSVRFIAPDPVERAMHRANVERLLPPVITNPPASTEYGRSLVEEMKCIVLQKILDIERRALERERGWSEVTEDDDDDDEEDEEGGEE